METIKLPDEEAEAQTGISPECQRSQCEQCPGWRDTDSGLMFCVHDCHKVPPEELPPELR
jgi:hypothetical protein